MQKTGKPSAYDLLRDKLDARDLLSRLGLNVVSELGAEIHVEPLCHESASGSSLHVNAHSGRWICRACESGGVYGDLIQLVEYAQTGGAAPTHGSAQRDSTAHRDAMRWLCSEYAIPWGEGGSFHAPALDALHATAMLAHRYLLTREDVLAWIMERWGFDRGTVESYGIGFLPDPLLPALVEEAQNPKSRPAFAASGLGWYTRAGKFCTRFAGRVTFPYLEHGRAVYLIGRQTKWTPTRPDGGHVPKYHKLGVHSEKRPDVSESITNDHLYNEQVMVGARTVIVAEGIADAVALSAMGMPVVSPVTVSFNSADEERFVRRAREYGTQRVEIIFDNELSGSGGHAAVRTGEKLVKHGLRVSILTLPLGAQQIAAREEVARAMGPVLFAEYEDADPNERRAIIAENFPDDAKRAWIKAQIEATKIDVAEWAAQEGVGASARFEEVRKSGTDVVDLQIAKDAECVDPDDDPSDRLVAFSDSIALAACVDDRLARGGYAGRISKLAGRGVDKATALQWINARRRDYVKPRRKTEKEEAAKKDAPTIDLTLLPPDSTHTTPSAPAPKQPEPAPEPGVPAAPAAPGADAPVQSEHDRLESVRTMVANAVEAKYPEETIGAHIANTLKTSMGFTVFACPDDIYLVRGNERIPVGEARHTSRFARLLYTASGLTNKKSAHKGYIAAVEYFLALDATEATEVSWSFVDFPTATTYFPTGDKGGTMIKIGRGSCEPTRMSATKVPAVAGAGFMPFRFKRDEEGGIDEALRVFRWTSLSPADRMLLIYWIACLPVLRLIGQVPIVRIEGGSGGGKTRTVDAVSYLVNGCKTASVPTAAAMTSLLSTEMLTIDDNRESDEMPAGMKATLLQATNLGAREKRKGNSDTGTVVERVCGALLMNGIEPIHDGRGELASRILTLVCSPAHRADDSPTASEELLAATLAVRDAFWSDASRRCAIALELDKTFGVELGEQIEEVFGATRIGRLSRYLRMMYLAWVAGFSEAERVRLLADLSPVWVEAFSRISKDSIDSLVGEELAVSAVRYAFSYARSRAKLTMTDNFADPECCYNSDGKVEYLGPMRASRLCRIARTAGKELNAPRAITAELRAGQLEARLVDGVEYLRASGVEVEIEEVRSGRRRFTLRREIEREDGSTPPADDPEASTPY